MRNLCRSDYLGLMSWQQARTNIFGGLMMAANQLDGIFKEFKRNVEEVVIILSVFKLQGLVCGDRLTHK